MSERSVVCAPPMAKEASEGNNFERIGGRRELSVRPDGAEIPLSWEQEQIWLHGMLFPDVPLYNETLTLLYRGEWKHAAFEAALTEICRRHEIWRTTIYELNGRPVQEVHGPAPMTAALVDLSSVPEDLREQRMEALAGELTARPFDLATGPLIRATAVRLGVDETRIFLSLHHLVFDGTSLRSILLPELTTLYATCAAGAIASLPAAELQYADYTWWQQGAAPRESGMEFWRSRLLGSSALQLPLDEARTPQTGRRGGVTTFELDAGLATAMRQMARRERTTVFTVMLASFMVVLARSSEATDVTVGTVYGGRSRTELEGVAGCFLNTLLLRTDLTGDPSFRDLLARMREVLLDAFDHGDAPFQEVVRQSLPRTSLGEAPVQAVFSWQPPSSELPAEWDLDVFGVFNGYAKFDLHLEVEEKHGAFRGRLMYNAELFAAATIEAMLVHWQNVIRAAAEEPECCIWKLNLLSTAEQHWLLETLNESRVEFPELCVHDLFARMAKETPERVAVCCGTVSLTYGELDLWSAGIAAHLLGIGVGEGAVVGLMMDRSTAMLAGLLGILRAGATYLPLDPTYPAARLEHMMRSSGASLLLTQRKLVASLPEPHPAVLAVEDCVAGPVAGMALAKVSPSSVAYILFTSGSTGLPKGVEVTHRGLTNLLWSMRQTPGIAAEDVLVAVTSISFDIAALELYLPLLVGAQVVIASTDETADPDLLAKRLRESGATLMQATPATWRMLIESGWKCERPMKLLCGGEAMTKTLATQLQRRSSSVWNMYGPTETTIWSACVQVQNEMSQIPLGEPVANTGIYVLDSHKAVVPAGVSGELYLGGDGLAKGYVGQPGLTAERFPLIKLPDGSVQRLYRTGDRVKRLRDGSLIFLGRLDRQIKLHGYRIELGEIEQVLNALPGVQESIVVQTHHASLGEMLTGFILPKVDVELRVEDLRAGAAKRLPKYMQPASLRIMTDVPLTLNGKLDRRKLSDLAIDEIAVESEPPLPGTERTLATLWSELLGTREFGRNENFFDLGGHSLLAVRCVAMANRKFGCKVSLASFLQAPTVAQFTQIIEGGSTPRVQLLKRGAAGARLLLWIGTEPWLTRLARDLKDDVTLYAITPDVEALEKTGARCTIETMTEQIMGDIRDLQAHGPYFLAGFCLRSLLAYEIARRLQDEGEEIGLLVIGDVYAPGKRPRWTPMQRIVRRVHRESWNLQSILRLLGNERSVKLRELSRSLLRRVKTWIVGGEAEPEILDELLQALYGAEEIYQPMPFRGQVLFLESGETRLLQGSTSESWDDLVDVAEVFSYPGIHENVLDEPYLSRAADSMQNAISAVMEAEMAAK